MNWLLIATRASLTGRLFLKAVRTPLLACAAGLLLIDAAWLLFLIATVYGLTVFWRPTTRVLFQARWFDVLAIALITLQSLYAFILGMAMASNRMPSASQIAAIMATSLVVSLIYQFTTRYKPKENANARI